MVFDINNIKIVIIDINKENINVFSNVFKDYKNIECICGDVVKYQDVNNIALISPANCFGYMNGGIDRTYSKIMYRGLENKVRNLYKQYGFEYQPNRHIVKIGSSITVKIDNLSNQYLICAPTMFLPQDVSTTNNAFKAFYAVLCAIDKSGIQIDTIVTPPFCTGTGKMNPVEAANQMLQAILYFMKNGRMLDKSKNNESFIL